MNFKLRYRISRETNIEPHVLIERIKQQLNDKKYRINNVTDRSVKFSTNPWMPKPNWTPTKLDGGEFEIIITNTVTTLGLSYYDYLLPTLIVVAAFGIVLINNVQYQVMLFFALFYLIGGIIHNITIKSKARELLNAVVDISE